MAPPEHVIVSGQCYLHKCGEDLITDDGKKKHSHGDGYDDPDFVNSISSSGFDLKDLKSMIFGGISSRFWMMRKHVN